MSFCHLLSKKDALKRLLKRPVPAYTRLRGGKIFSIQQCPDRPVISNYHITHTNKPSTIRYAMNKKLLLLIILLASAMGLKAQGGSISLTDQFDGAVILTQGTNINSHYAYSGTASNATSYKIQYGTADPAYSGTNAGTYSSQWVIEINDGSGWKVIFYNTSTSSPAPPNGTSGWTVAPGNSGDAITAFTVTLPSLAATTSQTNVSCNGGSNGAATVTASGGTAPYTYSWSPSGGTGATASGLAAGTYTVTITDAVSNIITKTFTITQPTAITVSSSSQTNVACNGASTGSASVTVSGGTGPYTYSWSPSGGTGATASGLTVGTYTVTITDANACTKTKSFTITQPTAITATTSQTNVSCNGGSNGSATVTASGGTGPYTYSWAPSGGTAATATGLAAGTYIVTITDANSCMATKSFTITQPTAITVSSSSQTNVACNGASTGSASVAVSGGTGPYTYSWAPSGGTGATASGLTVGTYTVTITDANGCTKTKSFTITQPTAITATTSQTNVSCNGGSNGSASVTASGGTGPYSYSWAPSGGTSATATGLAAGSYTVTITDANSCTATKSFTITQPTAITTGGSQTNVSCNGGSNGSATVTASGGTGPYTYSWAPSGGTSATATGLAAGTYTVTITDANSCIATKSFTITQPTAITATTSQTNVSCNGGSNGIASVTPSGGTAPYTYSWAPSGGTAATASGLAAGTYTVTITDANSCIATKTFTITQPTAITAATSQTNVSCNGGSNGIASVTPSGGTGPYTYSWSPSGGTGATATGLAAGAYTVTITDANSCTATKSFTITQPTAITTTGSQANVSCNGASNGFATVTASGGTGPYTYSWSPSGGTAATATSLAAGTYIVTITDANSCTATKSFTITQPTAITATTSQTNVSCNGGSNGSASVTASGGTGPYTYSWTPSGGTAATATGLAAGTYTVTITDANSCIATKSFTITEPTTITTSTSETDVTMNGGADGTASITASGGTPPYTYSWSPSGGTGATATGLIAGNYLVTVTDANSCQTTKNIVVSEPPPVTVTSVAVPTDKTYKLGDVLSFTVNFSDNVIVTGTPQLALTIGSSGKQISYTGGSGTSALTFSYTVSNGDLDTDGITVGALTLNGGTIKTGLTAATLTLNSVGSTASVNVDGIRPTLPASNIVVDNQLDPQLAVLTFSENLDASTIGTVADWVVTSHDGSIAFNINNVSVSSGKIIRLTLASVDCGDITTFITNALAVGHLKVTPPATLTDAAGNSYTAGLVTESGASHILDTTPPTISALSISNLTTNSATLNVTTSEKVRAFWVAVPTGSPAPTEAQVEAGTNYGGVTLIAHGIAGLPSGAGTTLNISGVAGYGNFDVYLAANDAAGNAAGTVLTSQGVYSNDATLSALTLSSGALAPTFASATTGYTASVSNATNSIMVTPAVNESHATIKVNGTAVVSGNASPAIALNVGTNTITIGVTAEDSITVKTYTVTVTRDKFTPTITFATINKTYGDADFDPGATSDNSNTAISYTSSNTAVATIVSGKIHIVGAGTTDITASQVADATDYAAADVIKTLTVDKKSLTVALNSTPVISKVYDGTPEATLAAGNYTLSGVVGTDVVSISSTAIYDDANAGTGKVVTAGSFVLSGAQGDNYTMSTVSATTTGSISVRPLMITADAQSKNYGDADPALTYQITSGSLIGTDSFSGTLTRDAGENVGTYPIRQGTLALSSNYDLIFTGANLTIGTRAITVTADAQSKNYGDADPTLTYQITSGSLAGTDSFSGTLTRDAGENVGTYAIRQGTLALSGNYNLTFTGADLTIGTRSINVTADAQSKDYGDVDPALTYQITSGSLVGTDSFSGALTRDASENVGTYAIRQGTLALSSNYNLTFTGANLTIGTRAITVTADAQSKNYGDADPTLTYQITSGSLVGTDAFTGSLTRDAGENVGTYAIRQGALALSSNYNLTFTGANLTIGTRAITVTADAQSKNYGNADPALTYQVTLGSLVGTDSFSGTLTRDVGENVGTYVIRQGTLALSSNYNLTFTGATLTIGTRAITITTDAKSKNYGDVDPALTYQITSGSLVGIDAFTGSLTRDAGENVGTYAIHQGTLALSSNYNLTFTGANLTIGTRAIAVTADVQSKSYGDADPALTYQITSGSLVGTDAFTGSLTRDVGENVGTYAIHQGTLGLSGNYNLTFTGANLTISTRSITVTADAQSKNYGDADPALTYQITSGSLVGTDSFSGALTRDAGENVGTYAIRQGTLGLSGNYNLTFTGANLTISTRSITVTADAQSKNYGDADPALTYQVTSGSLVGTDAFTGSLTRDAGENAGTYAIKKGTLSLGSNYNLTFGGANLTINKATLIVTANNLTKAYGQANPALTIVYTGFVSGDDASKLTAQPTITTTAATNSAIGTYPITVSGAASLNYSISYVPGTLTITVATLTITADNQTKIYGEVNPALSVHYSGFINGDDASKLTTAPSLTTTASASSGTGDYTITASGAVMPNYTIVYQSGTLTINKAQLTVTAGNQSRAYGNANPELTISYSGFVNGDDASKLAAVATASTAAGANTPPGTYPITVTGAASANYTFAYVQGTLTIIPLTDASLSGLQVNQGRVALSPDFSPGIYSYSATVESQVDRVNITALFASTATAQINGSVLFSNRSSNDILLHPGDNSISINITAQDGSQHTYTINIYRGLPASSITATNILTPNGDGKNDTWQVKDINLYPDNTVSVYDRAGRLVYSKHGYQNDWDGTLKGSPLEQGTYYFTIDLGNGGNLIKGFITIIKE